MKHLQLELERLRHIAKRIDPTDTRTLQLVRDEIISIEEVLDDTIRTNQDRPEN